MPKDTGRPKGSEHDSAFSQDDLPPFLRDRRGFMDTPSGEKNWDDDPEFTEGEEPGSQHPWNDGCKIPQEDWFSQEPKKSFWDRFRPSPISTQKERTAMRKSATRYSRIPQVISLCLLCLLTFVFIQQMSTGGVRVITILAILFTLPYIVTFLYLDFSSYLNSDRTWNPANVLNAIFGPAIIALAISSCIFSAPLERNVWIIGGATTGPHGTLYTVPLFSKIVFIPMRQEIKIHVSGETADGAQVSTDISTVVHCCIDDSEKIIEQYRQYGPLNKPPTIDIRNYVADVFDTAFKKAVARVKMSDMQTAYRVMAKGISKKQIRSERALVWDGTFTVLNSTAIIPRKPQDPPTN
jgi:heme/copper-type cytochrome/quinol oxidase subunit 4